MEPGLEIDNVHKQLKWLHVMQSAMLGAGVRSVELVTN
jgi:hypothetical protein